jgi:hypothetical protein
MSYKASCDIRLPAVLTYLNYTNARIDLTAQDHVRIFVQGRELRKFIIFTIIIPLKHNPTCLPEGLLGNGGGPGTHTPTRPIGRGAVGRGRWARR